VGHSSAGPEVEAAQVSDRRPLVSAARSRRALSIILFLYLALGLWYSVAAPLGEAPDELAHFRYIRYIVDHGRGPRTGEEREVVGYKGHEPPLYYALCAAATSWVDTSVLPGLKEIDPDRYPRHSIPDEVLIRDAVLHTEDEAFPYEGAVLAWHLARVLSVLLGAGTVAIVYLVARDVFPLEPGIAVGAAILTAFVPQYVYLSSALNNDNLAVLLSTVALWTIVRIARDGGTARQYALLGLLIGLGRLTKFYTVILIPMAVAAIAFASWRSRSVRKLLIGVSILLAVLLLVSAPWLWSIEPDHAELVPQGWAGRAHRLLDVVHMERWFSSQGRGTVGGGATALPRALLNFWRQEPGRWALLLFKSYWAFFGAVTLEAGAGVYVLFLVVALLCLAGLVLMVVRQVRSKRMTESSLIALGALTLQTLAFLLVMVINYGVMNRLPGPAQGRHLYPAIGAVSILFSVGLSELFRRRFELAIVGLGLAMLTVTVWCLPAYILPGYLAPLPVRTVECPELQHAVDVRFGDALALVGCDLPETEIVPGGTASLSLYWRGLRPMPEDYVYSVSLVDGDGRGYRLWEGHPAAGRYPTRAWDPGDYVRDSLLMAVPSCVEPGRQYRLSVEVRSNSMMTEEVLGRADLPCLQVVAEGSRHPTTILEADLGDGLVLTGYDVVSGDGYAEGPVSVGYRGGLGVILYWRHEGEGAGSVPVKLTLLKTNGQEWEREERSPWGEGPDYCASYWFSVGATTPPGEYRAKVRAHGLGKVEFDVPVRAINRVREFSAPQMKTPSGVTLGDCVRLEGYDVVGSRSSSTGIPALMPGDSLELTLYWRALCPVLENYTVFAHLVDANDTVLAQADGLPRGDYSTLFWAEGEVVEDRRVLITSSEARGGDHEIEVGLYRVATGERLAVRDESGVEIGDRVVLDSVRISMP